MNPIIKTDMKDRIFKNWKTSLMGFVLGVIATISLLKGETSLSEYALFAPLWLGLIYIKDKVLKVRGV